MAALSDNDRYRLKIFHMHLARLSKFAKPLYGKSGYTVNYTNTGTKLKTRNLATELRMAGIVNELRSFMLNDDPAYFDSIANIASRYYHDEGDDEKVDLIKKWKKQWKNMRSQKTGIVINVNGEEILKDWGEVLDVLIYGKFIHNKKDKHKIYAYSEADPMLTGHMGLVFSQIAINIDRFLRTFDHHFIAKIK